jgi:inosine-uridine nucleoside N-ribohydrolase
MDDSYLFRNLRRPQLPVDVVLDSDTYNEIDDQFALAYLARSSEQLHLKAIYAAPFFNKKVGSPGEGMERSFQEIFRVLSLLGADCYADRVFRGSTTYLPDERSPVRSDAAEHLVTLARQYSSEKPLYAICIGAITNIASALLMDPGIARNIVIIWLGGHSYDWPDTREFNMAQDIPAARVVFGADVPVVQLPCKGVVSQFLTTGPELERWLKGKNELCDYLVSIAEKQAQFDKQEKCWSRPIWDVTAVAWLLGERFMEDRLGPSPIPEPDFHYSFDRQRRPIKYVYWIYRDRLFADLVDKLTRRDG